MARSALLWRERPSPSYIVDFVQRVAYIARKENQHLWTSDLRVEMVVTSEVFNIAVITKLVLNLALHMDKEILDIS